MAKKPSKFLNESQVKLIENAVAEAELKTSAEIVPVVARESGRYDRPEDVAGLWLGMIFMAIAWPVLQSQSAAAAMWGSDVSRFELLILIGAAVVGFILGAVITTYSWTVRRLFTPHRQMRQEVHRRADEVFFDQRVHHTEGDTGLLIYISLYERTAALLADHAAMEKLGQPTLDRLRDKLVDGIKAGDMGTALCETIQDAADQLAEHFPRAEGDRNELANALVLLD